MLIVTIAALVMAASLGWFAFRLLQEEQRRSEARVALLTAALDEPVAPAVAQPTTWDAAAARRAQTPGLDAARSAARVATPAAAPSSPSDLPRIVHLEDDGRGMRRFASELGGESEAAVSPNPVAPLPLHTGPVADAGLADVEARGTGLFADAPAARAGDARGLIAIAGVVLTLALALAYVWFGSGSTSAPAAVPDATASKPVAAAAAASGSGMPLELLSLMHEQRGGRLVVRGLVRNPVAGSDRPRLVASVVLLDQAGSVVGSAQAPVDAATLKPGDDAGFAVQTAADAKVRRYRVTFRAADGALVPHADRRK